MGNVDFPKGIHKFKISYEVIVMKLTNYEEILSKLIKCQYNSD